MRIWDISVEQLCNNHLLGEHRELHAIWSILINDKKGYSKHPETLRWQGKLKALYLRHEHQVKEMGKRGFNHYSHLDENLATGKNKQDVLIDTIDAQIELLRNKECKCRI